MLMYPEEVLNYLTVLKSYMFLICLIFIFISAIIVLWIFNKLASSIRYLEKTTKQASHGHLIRGQTEHLLAGEQKFRQIIENASDIIFTMDMSGMILDISTSLEKILGFDPIKARGQYYSYLIHQQDQPKLKAAMQSIVNHKKKICVEYRIRDNWDRIHWHRCNAGLVKDDAGHPLYIVGVAWDISKQKQAFAKACHQAEIDALTGCFNRGMLDSLMEEELKKAQQDQKNLSVIIVDLDYFKKVNDTYGHIVGDEVLQKTANFFKSMIRRSDILIRYGGEEFVILALDTNLEGGVLLGEKLCRQFAKYDFAQGGHLTLSAGVATFKNEDTMATLLKRSDQALYIAKQTGRNRVCKKI